MGFILQLLKFDEKVLNMDEEKSVIQAKHILYLIKMLNLDNCIVQVQEYGHTLIFLDNVTKDCLCQVNFDTGTFAFNSTVREFSRPHRRYHPLIDIDE